MAKTKAQVLTELNTILNTSRSVKIQLRSAPANVRSSFKLGCIGCGEGQAALRQATTKRQIRAAVGEIVGSSTKEVLPFATYILSQCEGPATSSVPTTP